MGTHYLVAKMDFLSARINYDLTRFLKPSNWYVLFLLIIPLMLMGCGPKIRYFNDAHSTIYSNEKLSSEAQRGREIFNSSGKCWKCHGLDADAHTRLFLLHPELDPQPTNLRSYNDLKYTSDEEMREVIMNGIQGPSMVAWFVPKVHLTEADLKAIISYLKEIRQERT